MLRDACRTCECVRVRFLETGLTFQDRRGLKDLLLDPGVLPADGCQELQDELGALGLPGSRLAAASQPGE